MRSLGSISSELCEMQRLAHDNAVLGAKDAEWQRRITLAATPPHPIPNPTVSPPRRFALDPSQFNVSSFVARDPRAFALSQKPAPAPAPVYAPSTPPAPVSFPLPLERSPPKPGSPSKREAALVEPPPPDAPLPAAAPRHGSPVRSSTPSASTLAHSPQLDDCNPKKPHKKPRSHTRGVGKIRRHRMTKQEEARFDPQDLVDLRGSTAAQSRKMSVEERDIMLHKRRLRNRQSAARSRDKQRKTIGEVGDEVDDLVARTDALQLKCHQAAAELRQLRDANDTLRKENEQLRQANADLKQTNDELKQTAAAAQSPMMQRNGSTLRFSLSNEVLDKLDKIMGGSSDGLLPTSSDTAGMYRIPSKLRLSLSTDRLADSFPTSGSLPPLSRNVSVLERLLDYANTNNSNNNLNNMDSLEINDSVNVDEKKE